MGRDGKSAPCHCLLAAGTTAYAIGEGLGRLACISFGCCYGPPTSRVHPLLQRVFLRHGFTFTGKTKKIAYESGLDNTEVVPIQAMTSVFLVATGLTGICLFLNSLYAPAFLVTTALSQGWRCASETLRCDHRGKDQISAYQVMAATAIPYAFLLCMIFPGDGGVKSDFALGLKRLWDPSAILLLQGLQTGSFSSPGEAG